jgi:hypothetical protein
VEDQWSKDIVPAFVTDRTFNSIMRIARRFSVIFDFLQTKNNMKSKFILLSILFMPIALSVYAQTSDAEAEAMANLLGVQKREAVMKLVPVTGKDSVAFWKLYDEYRQKNNAMAKTRIQAFEQMASSYTNMTPTLADELARKQFAMRDEQERVLQEYYKKIKTATNAVVAFEFYQAEIYMLTQLRAVIMQQIPTYGEFQNAIQRKN